MKIQFKICAPLLIALSALITGCAQNQAQLDKFAADIRDLREIQAQQTASLDEVRSEVRKLTGKVDETQNVAMGKTAELEKTLEHYESRVPPPPGVPEDLLSQDEAAISRIQGDDAQLFLRGLRLLRKGVFEESRDAFNQFLDKTADNAFTDNALFWIGIISDQLGQSDRAIAAFSDAFRRFPAEDRVPAGLYYLGESFVKIGSVNDGVLAWQKLVDEHPAPFLQPRPKPGSRPLNRLPESHVRNKLASGPAVTVNSNFVSYHFIRLAKAAPDVRPGAVSSELRWPANILPGAVIGNFDGMHLGHKSLFDLLQSRLAVRINESGRVSESGGEAQSSLKPAAIFMSFIPHPRRVLTGVSRAQARTSSQAGSNEWCELTPIRSKCQIAAQLGFDYACFVRFSSRLQSLSAEQFVTEFLARDLGLKLVAVGYDWAFGKGRSGNVDQLREIGARNGIEVLIAPKFELPAADGSAQRISSSLVKAALAAGDLEETARIIGRPFSISGRVVHGDHRGQTIGFPTANLHLPLQLLPPNGVYCAICSVSGFPRTFPGVINIGTRPTFAGTDRRFEVHLLDFPGTAAGDSAGPNSARIYGRRIGVDLISKIRDEVRFDSLADLKKQIGLDLLRAREILGAMQR